MHALLRRQLGEMSGGEYTETKRVTNNPLIGFMPLSSTCHNSKLLVNRKSPILKFVLILVK